MKNEAPQKLRQIVEGIFSVYVFCFAIKMHKDVSGYATV